MKWFVLCGSILASPALAAGGTCGTAGVHFDVYGNPCTPVYGTGSTPTTPSYVAPVAIAPAPSTALETGHVFKASAGTLYRSYLFNTGNATVYYMEFDATTVPGNGAVSPKQCIPVPANSYVNSAYSPVAEAFTTGIVAAISSTSCLVMAQTSVGFFSAQFQ